MGHGVQQMQVGARLDRQVDRRNPAHLGQARVHADQPGALLHRLDHPAEEDWMALGHVGAGDQDHLGVLDILVGAYGAIGAEGAGVADHGGGHAGSGVAVEIGGTYAGPEQLAEGVELLHAHLAGVVAGDRVGAVVRDQLLELVGHGGQGFIPRGLDHLAVPANERGGATVVGQDRLPLVDALRTEQAIVDRISLGASYSDGLVALHADLNAATGSAETAGGVDPLLRLHVGRSRASADIRRLALGRRKGLASHPHRSRGGE